MNKKHFLRNWALHYVEPSFLYLPMREKDNKKGHRVFVYLRYGRNSNWYNLTTTQLQNTVVGVYNSKGKLIYCTAYNNNGTIVNTLSGSGFAIKKLPYITTDYDVAAYDYLILPYGDYTVKVMRYGTNLNTYTGEDSFTFTVNNDGQTGTLQYVYVDLFSEDYINYQMTFNYEWVDYSDAHTLSETVVPHPSGTTPGYLQLTTPEIQQYTGANGYGTFEEYRRAATRCCQNTPILTYYRNRKGNAEILGEKDFSHITAQESYSTLLAKDGFHVYIEKKTTGSADVYNSFRYIDPSKYYVNAEKNSSVEYYIIYNEWVKVDTTTYYPYQAVSNVSGINNGSYNKRFSDSYGYHVYNHQGLKSGVSSYWTNVGAYRYTTSKDFDTTMNELSAAFANVIQGIVSGTDASWETKSVSERISPFFDVPKSIVFNNSDSWSVSYQSIDSIEYRRVVMSTKTEIVNIPLVDFGDDYEGYTSDNYWTASNTSILYRYKPLVVDMSDVPNYTP